MEPAYPKYRLNWLANDIDPLNIDKDTGDIESFDLPIPKELGMARMRSEQIAQGISLFHGIHKFTPQAFGTLIPLTKFDGQFEEDNFCVQIAYGGQFSHFENYPKKAVIFRPGLSLFRYAKLINVTSYLDGSHDSEMVTFSIPRSTLERILGDADTNFLIRELRLDPSPAVEIHKTPLTLGEIMMSAVTNPHVGRMRKLHIQGKVLEFFGALINNLQTNREDPNTNSPLAKRIHECLLSTDGRITTIDQLAAEFSLPARYLNSTFQKEYGESISTFMSGYRLAQARSLLEQRNVPMKIISANLGYSHVNHFITAFKRKFGVTPGTVRRNKSGSKSSF